MTRDYIMECWCMGTDLSCMLNLWIFSWCTMFTHRNRYCHCGGLPHRVGRGLAAARLAVSTLHHFLKSRMEPKRGTLRSSKVPPCISLSTSFQEEIKEGSRQEDHVYGFRSSRCLQSRWWLARLSPQPQNILDFHPHWMDMYGQLKEPPLRSMSRIRVSMGVLPTSRTKKSCSMTWALTERSEGRRRSSLPKRVGWLGYCDRSYSSRAHCAFSCRDSMWAESDNPQASAKKRGKIQSRCNCWVASARLSPSSLYMMEC